MSAPRPNPEPLDRDWNERYTQHNTPWETGRPSTELTRAVESGELNAGNIARPRLLEFGCGTGTNAIYLSQHGFEVTAVDGSEIAIARAREKAAALASSNVTAPNFRMADVLNLPEDILGSYDVLFDRGCYHCIRHIGVAAYQRTLARVTRPGTMFLLLTGNANEIRDGGGPPQVSEQQLREELGGMFDFVSLEPFKFDDNGNGYRPLGWRCLLRRRAD